MRLIDADKLVEICRKGWKLFGREDEKLKHWVDEDDIRNQPTAKAIPIEWVEDYIKKHTFTFRIYDTTNENDLDAITTNELTLVSKMLEDWEKENEGAS